MDLHIEILGSAQYYPEGAPPIPENQIFAQYHAPQTAVMKSLIIKELSSNSPKIRVVFATVAMGMGVDIPTIRHIIHIGPPRTIREYVQETGRAGRDGSKSKAVLYYDNHAILPQIEKQLVIISGVTVDWKGAA